MVTHNISFLPRVDQIVVMDEGVITEVGTYYQLLDKGGAFAEFLRSYLVDNGVENVTTAGDGKQGEEKEGDAESDTDSETRKIKNEILRKLGASTTPTPGATEETPPKSRNSISLKRRQSRRRSSSSIGERQRQPTGGTVTTVDSKLRARRASGRDLRREAGKLMTVEESATGNVELSVYLTYFKFMRWDLTCLIVLLYFIWNGLNVFNSIWLSEWSNDAERFASPAQANSAPNRDYRLGVYGAIGALQGIFIIISTYVFAYATMRAAAKLHSNMLERVMHAPMSFFDTTPSGRLLNRFSKDVDSLDTNVPANLRMFFTTFCVVLSMVFTICYSTPIFLVMLIPLGVLYFIAQRFYVCSSRQLRRLESVMRSPIYSLFGESITGQAVIRAAQQERRFIAENERRIDLTNMAYFPYIESQRWLNLGLTAVGALAVFSASLFAVFAREGGIASGIVGLAISNALAITGPLNWMVRQTSELETNIVSAERMKEYTEIVQEPPWDLPEDISNVPREWPQYGAVDFNDYQTRYRTGLDLVLRGITAHIEPSEKVGIVGRTGAGKSSLTLALFRIIEPAGGSIVIDGVDIVKIGLHKLRSRLTIIPQDPILFSGTLRFNLDPGEKHTDDAIWLALEQAHLKQWASATSKKLEFAVAEEGQNLSVGQRQLVCLARALLRKTRILVLDEATAAVDMETDELIQESISTEFKDSTVLTIAHRLNTILDYNRVMVLANGKIKEFDSPKNLLATLPSNGSNNGAGGEPSEFALLARDANITPERIAALGLADNNSGPKKTNGNQNTGNGNAATSSVDSGLGTTAAAGAAAAAAVSAAQASHENAGNDDVNLVNLTSQPSRSSNDLDPAASSSRHSFANNNDDEIAGGEIVGNDDQNEDSYVDAEDDDDERQLVRDTNIQRGVSIAPSDDEDLSTSFIGDSLR